MRAIGKWSVEHRVSVNLIMIFLFVAGSYVVYNMKREVFPQFNLDMIDVSVMYPGASPEEAEEGICIKIEEQLKSLEGVKTMYSTALEGYGGVTLELDSDVDIQEKLDEVKSQVDLIDSFPKEAEDPVTTEIKNNDPAIYLAIYGDVDEKLLRKTAEEIRDDLVATEYISLANLIGVRDYEISVEVSEENMRRYNLSFDQVAAAVKSGSIDLPGGKIRTQGGEFLVRAKGKMYHGEEFERIPVVPWCVWGMWQRLWTVLKIPSEKHGSTGNRPPWWWFEEPTARIRFPSPRRLKRILKRTGTRCPKALPWDTGLIWRRWFRAE